MVFVVAAVLSDVMDQHGQPHNVIMVGMYVNGVMLIVENVDGQIQHFVREKEIQMKQQDVVLKLLKNQLYILPMSQLNHQPVQILILIHPMTHVMDWQKNVVNIIHHFVILDKRVCVSVNGVHHAVMK